MDITRPNSRRNSRVSRALVLIAGLFIVLAVGVFSLSGIGQTSTSSAHIAGKSKSTLRVLAAAHRGSKKRCQPGRQASLRPQRIPPGAGTKLRSKVLILACGSVPHYGPVEIVGYDTSDGFCYATDSLKQEASEGGLCVPEDSNWQTFCEKGAVCPGNVTWTSVDGTPYFQLSQPVGLVS
jgi:hypothetical protein